MLEPIETAMCERCHRAEKGVDIAKEVDGRLETD